MAKWLERLTTVPRDGVSNRAGLAFQNCVRELYHYESLFFSLKFLFLAFFFSKILFLELGLGHFFLLLGLGLF